MGRLPDLIETYIDAYNRKDVACDRGDGTRTWTELQSAQYITASRGDRFRIGTACEKGSILGWEAWFQSAPRRSPPVVARFRLTSGVLLLAPGGP